MALKELLLKQIAFEDWANQLILSSLKSIELQDERSLLLFSHILSSSSMWLSRVNGTPITTTLLQERSLSECEILHNANIAAWMKYLTNVDEKELDRIVEFIFPLDGSKKRMKVCDAVIHVVNHSTYHRGQIVARLKGSIDPLPLTTYIVFASENSTI